MPYSPRYIICMLLLVLLSDIIGDLWGKFLLFINLSYLLQTMEFLRDGEELVFLYQLTEGGTNSSYACYIAAQADLPPEIVSRAKEVCIH